MTFFFHLTTSKKMSMKWDKREKWMESKKWMKSAFASIHTGHGGPWKLPIIKKHINIFLRVLLQLILCPLDWSTGCPESWLNIISEWSVGLCSEDTGIWTGRLSKAGGPSQRVCGGASPIPWGCEQNKSGGRLGLLSAWPWAVTLTFYPQHSGFQAFRLTLESIPSACRWHIVGLLSLHN